MEDPSTFECQDIFQFMGLPPELRVHVYRFAAAEPHFLTLYAHYDDRSDSLKGYAVQKDLALLGTCKTIRAEMEEVLYSENTFHLCIGKYPWFVGGAQNFQIDIGRIQKCYIYVDAMTQLDDNCNEVTPSDPVFLRDVQWFMDFVAALVFKGHQMKYLLVECDALPDKSLAKGLSPLSMLRNIRLVHLYSVRNRMSSYFRLLEGLMMGGRPQPFRNMDEFWKGSTCFDSELLRNPVECWFVKGLDITSSAEVQSEDQVDATAKALYSIVGMKGDYQHHTRYKHTRRM